MLGSSFCQRRRLIDTALRGQTNGATGQSRRHVLLQLATTGAVLSAAGLPVTAQDGPQRSRGSPAKAATPAPGSIAGTIADFAVKLRYEDLPTDVVRTTRRTILDTIGCAIGGSEAGPSRIASKLAAEVNARSGSKSGATLFCSGLATSLDRAVFANGVMIRYLDFNDGYITPKGGGHPSDLLAPLLSTAEVYRRSGKDLITATVLGFEVACKLMDVVDMRGLGLDQATVVGPAAVVGAGRLMGLTREQLVHAIGITVGGNTSLNQGRVGTLSNWKAFAAAEASRKAIFAAQLAQAGMTGPTDIYEGPQGFFKSIHREPFELARLGAPYGIMRTFTKRFPLGQYSQTVAEAAAQARAFAPNVDDIAEVNIHVCRNAIKVMADSPDKWRPKSSETADHSMPYAAGVVLMYGTIDESYYAPKHLDDQRLLGLVGKVRCIHSEEADRHEKDFNLCVLEVVQTSGQRKSFRVEYHRGHPKNPMTDAEMEAKFRGLARKHLSAAKTDALLRQLWKLEDMPLAGALVRMTKV